jgi:putative membrane protein
MNFIIRIVISTLAVLVASYLLPDSMVHVDGFTSALIVAVVLAFLNAVVKPIMVILTIPATVFTFGLFLLAINAFLIMMADYFVDGFVVYGFWSALLFSFVLSIANAIFEAIRKRDEQPPNNF